MDSPLKIAVLLMTAVIGAVILCFIAASVVRRILRGWMYRELDKQRAYYHHRLNKALKDQTATSKIDLLRARPGSPKWRAIFEILLEPNGEENQAETVAVLFRELGYVSYFEEKLKSSNALTRANAIDKLGRMRSQASTDKIIASLGSGEPEIIAVCLRALGKIGTDEGLSAILKRLSYLVRKSLITRKAAESALIQFGEGASPSLIASGWEQDHPKIKAIILEALSRLGPEEALPLAIHNLQNVSPEVRAKALKVINGLAWILEDFDGEILLPLLADESWFVRLHAARALGNLRYEKAARALGGLLFDGNWQVRNGAATALSAIGGKGIEIFRDILSQEDNYAKESICEEIERADLVTRLIENLESDEPEFYEESREILETMCSLNFRTQCKSYAEWGENEKIREELNHILKETGAK